MRIFSIFFCGGVWLLQQQAELPDARLPGIGLAVCASLLAAALCGCRAARGSTLHAPGVRILVALLAFAAGLLWAASRAHERLHDALPMNLEGVDIEVVGRVAELPHPLEAGVRFAFEVESAVEAVPGRVQLSWYAPRGGDGVLPTVRAGERWRLVVRLKRPHGFANPHGFDYEAWLLERAVRATGYVSGAALLLDAAPATWAQSLHRLRGTVRDRFLAALGDRPYAGILVALAVGDQRAIPAAQWTVFRRTGVAHLVAISGLHVSLVGLVAGGLAAWAWRRSPALALRLPVRKAAAAAALGAAAAYAALAGLGIPVQRALIMLAVVVGALWLGRESSPGRVLAPALIAVLVVDPWAVLSAGFWLSFGAVGVIAFVLGGRVAPVRGWRAAVRIQLAISVATMPALLALFQAFSLVSPLANAIAIPLVSFCIAPLALLAVVLPLDEPLLLAHAGAGAMMRWLDWLSGLAPALWQQAAPPPWLTLSACAAAALLLLPRGTPGKPGAAVMLAVLLLWQPPRPPPGAFRATVLDVGQGLAVHVQTATHDLLYDAGPPYGTAADAGSRVVLPHLAASGVKRLHTLVLSHDDSDHVGGAASVIAGLPVARILAGEPDDVGEAAASARPRDLRADEPCQAGKRWQHDGVAFEILHPLPGSGLATASRRRGNDHSCVLRVVARGGSLLLTGDVEATAEAAMLSRLGRDGLASSVIVSAHHGSRSSSSPAFVDAVLPEAVIHSSGYRNPFGHPHAGVWARWSAAGARNWRTDSQGAIRVEVAAAGVDVVSQRTLRPRYWHGR